MKLVFATRNHHKINEVRKIMPAGFDIAGLEGLALPEVLPETSDSIEGNATEKARFVYNAHRCDCFADDSGLEVEALDNAPGVYSARYAGDDCSDEDNIRKLLSELEAHQNRSARFKTVLCLILSGREYLFTGVIEGEILKMKQGSGGFGYDPVFMPAGHSQSFAQMSPEEKNAISHRSLALGQMVHFLQSQ